MIAREQKELSFAHKMVKHYHTQFWKLNTEIFFERIKKDLFNVSISSIRNASHINNQSQSEMDVIRQMQSNGSQISNERVLTSEIQKKEGESEIRASKFNKDKKVEVISKGKDSAIKAETLTKEKPISPYLPDEKPIKKSNIHAPVQPAQPPKKIPDIIKKEEPLQISKPPSKIEEVLPVAPPIAVVKKKSLSKEGSQQEVQEEDVGSSSFYEMIEKQKNEKSRIEDESVLNKLDDKSFDKQKEIKVIEKVEESVQRQPSQSKQQKYLEELQPVIQMKIQAKINVKASEDQIEFVQQQQKEQKPISSKSPISKDNCETVEMVYEKIQKLQNKQDSVQLQAPNQSHSQTIIQQSICFANMPDQPSQQNNSLTIMSKSEQYQGNLSQQQVKIGLGKAQNSYSQIKNSINTTDEGRQVEITIETNPINSVESEINSIMAEFLAWIAQTNSHCEFCQTAVSLNKQNEQKYQILQKKVEELISINSISQKTKGEIVIRKDQKIKKLQQQIEGLQRDLQSQSLQSHLTHKITRQRSEHCLTTSKERSIQPQVKVPTPVAIAKDTQDYEIEAESESQKNSSDYEEQKKNENPSQQSQSSDSDEEKA